MTPATMTDNPPLLTDSRVRAFRRCAREHFHRFEQGYQPIASDEALDLGALVHVGLESWWRALQLGSDPLAVALANVECATADPFLVAKATAMLVGYDARWRSEPIEVLAVEAEFRCPLVNPETGAAGRIFTVAGKIDAIARLPDGRVVIVEHKTTSETVGPGSDYWKRLTLDSQISTYFLGARALGFDVAGCLYDVLSKPGLRPLKATPLEARKFTKDGRLYANQREADETPAEFGARVATHIAENADGLYQRGEVVRLADEERDAAFDTWQVARNIRDAQLADRWPRNPDACVRFGKTCAFFDICCRTDSLDNAERFTRSGWPHPELSRGIPMGLESTDE